MSAATLVCVCGSDRFGEWQRIVVEGSTVTFPIEHRCTTCGTPAPAAAPVDEEQA